MNHKDLRAGDPIWVGCPGEPTMIMRVWANRHKDRDDYFSGPGSETATFILGVELVRHKGQWVTPFEYFRDIGTGFTRLAGTLAVTDSWFALRKRQWHLWDDGKVIIDNQQTLF